MKLKGLGTIVTGGSLGLGLAIARAFVTEGANVLVCARGATELAAAEVELKEIASEGQIVSSLVVDVSQQSEVRRLVESAQDAFGRIDVLVNNAGILGPIALVEDAPWEEWANTIQVNLFGTVLTTMAVVPVLKRQRSGKIINLSGGGATAPRPRATAYASAKAAVVRFTETVAEEVREFGIDVNAVAPGALNTRMLDQLLQAGPERAGEEEYLRSVNQKKLGGAQFERSTDLCVFLASSASNGISGKLISAVWDPWETLPIHKSELSGDIYSLRRIVPKDRGKSWGEK